MVTQCQFLQTSQCRKKGEKNIIYQSIHSIFYLARERDNVTLSLIKQQMEKDDARYGEEESHYYL